MAIGDVKANLQSVGNNGILDIKPPNGEEWVIHNIYYNQGTVEFYKTNGVHSILFDVDNSRGGRLGALFHCTSTQWLQLKNKATTATLIGYDGIQTK